jgi:hypothetical protein
MAVQGAAVVDLLFHYRELLGLLRLGKVIMVAQVVERLLPASQLVAAAVVAAQVLLADLMYLEV